MLIKVREVPAERNGAGSEKFHDTEGVTTSPGGLEQRVQAT